MRFDRRSKIKDIWKNPAGHDVLVELMRRHGRSENWIRGRVVANLAVAMLDRLAGAGFADALVELCNSIPEGMQPGSAEETEPAWWKKAVVYQIYVPSFMDGDHDGIGDVAGVTQRLPYLASLGVDTLWLRLLLDATDDNDKGMRNLVTIPSNVGNEEDFDTFLKAARQRDMRVVVNFDIASTSARHAWFDTAKKGGAKQEYYVFHKGIQGAPPNNWSRGPVPAWKWLSEQKMWALRLCGNQRMDLDWDNPAVRAEMQNVVKFWKDKGVDGVYLGSANLISKTGYGDGSEPMGDVMGITGFEKVAFGPQLLQYLKELRTAATKDDDAFMVGGEVRAIGTGMAGLLAEGKTPAVDLLFDGSHIAMRGRVTGEENNISLLDLKKYYLRWMKEFSEKGWLGLCLETPETPRMVSRLGAGMIYRATLAKLLGTLLFTLRGTPIIYQGEELGLTNTKFANLQELRDNVVLRMCKEWGENQGEAAVFARAVHFTADHARTPMPWGNGKNAGFTGAEPWIRMPDGVERLNAAAQMRDSGSVWSFYKKLIELRRKYACLVIGSFNPVFAKNKNVFCYFRICEGEKFYVEMNLTDKEVPRPGRLARNQKLMLSNYENVVGTLRPYEANIYWCESLEQINKP